MKINILAETGQLGSRIVEALLTEGTCCGDLIVSRRNPAKARHLADRGIEVRHADLDRPKTLLPAFTGTDVLMLISSMAAVEHRITQHECAVTSAALANVGRVVMARASAARTDSPFPVAPFLLYAESKLRLSGLDWSIRRNGLYLDPLADWAPRPGQDGAATLSRPNGTRRLYLSR